MDMREEALSGHDQPLDIRQKYEYYDRVFHKLIADEEKIHEANQKRIRGGIQCLIWIPLIFLTLMFLTDAEKVIFLILWIVSLFLIAGYLIYVEYTDFNTQDRIREYRNQGMEETRDSLIGGDIEVFEEAVEELMRQISQKKAENRDRVLSLLEPMREKLTDDSREGEQDGKYH